VDLKCTVITYKRKEEKRVNRGKMERGREGERERGGREAEKERES
jgi:hypothetical protein